MASFDDIQTWYDWGHKFPEDFPPIEVHKAKIAFCERLRDWPVSENHYPFNPALESAITLHAAACLHMDRFICFDFPEHDKDTFIIFHDRHMAFLATCQSASLVPTSHTEAWPAVSEECERLLEYLSRRNKRADLAELMEVVECSKPTIIKLVNTLLNYGYLERNEGKRSGVAVTPKGRQFLASLC